jgi:hypothetical protein
VLVAGSSLVHLLPRARVWAEFLAWEAAPEMSTPDRQPIRDILKVIQGLKRVDTSFNKSLYATERDGRWLLVNRWLTTES